MCVVPLLHSRATRPLTHLFLHLWNDYVLTIIFIRGKWASELLGVEEIRLYNAEVIYHKGADSPRPCAPAWHRDTIAAPFATSARSVTFNIYFDNITAGDPNNGDGLIFMKGSHRNLTAPPTDPDIYEPSVHLGDVLAHDAHIFHTTSGRECWRRRSMQFRYVAAQGGSPRHSHQKQEQQQRNPTRFLFGMNRFPHGPVPWSLAHAPELFPHGLTNGDILQGPGYPLVYPKPLESEHVPLNGNVWSIFKIFHLAKESQGMMMKNYRRNERGKEVGHLPLGFFTLDGPVLDPDLWELVDPPEFNGMLLPAHKQGLFYQRAMQQKSLLAEQKAVLE